MASYYVRSGAGGAGTGADWANAYTTLAAAVSGKAAGDIFYVSEDHSETTAGAITITFPGTVASPNLVYCVDHTGTVPPVHADLRTTGQVATSGANSQTYAGNAYIYGLKFVAGSGAVNASLTFATTDGNTIILDSCLLHLQGSGSVGTLTFGASGVHATYVRLQDCTITTSNSSHTVRPIAVSILRNCTFTGTAVSNLFSPFTGRPGFLLVEGCDLTTVLTNQNLFGVTSQSVLPAVFKDCKLDSDGVVAPTPTFPGTAIMSFVNCDSASTNYNFQTKKYEGTLTTETTIVRTGGASDGTTTIAWKIVTTANSEWYLPFECPPIAIWNETTGSSVTATVEGIWGGGAVPNNDEIWIDAQYLGTSGFPIASHANGSKASNLASASALASSAESWGGSTTAFKMTVTFTPEKKGWVYIYAKAAKVSSTFYVDPKVTLS